MMSPPPDRYLGVARRLNLEGPRKNRRSHPGPTTACIV